jgi:hypothetical protein
VNDNNSKTKSKPSIRGKPSEEKPYCWSSRAALERIREFQDMNHATATLAIYGALTDIASRHGSESFRETQRSIMKLSGVGSDNTLRKHLDDLCEMRLLRIKENRYGNGLRAPSTYTLLSVRNVPQPLRNVPQPDCGTKKRTKKEPHPSDGHSSPSAQRTRFSSKNSTRHRSSDVVGKEEYYFTKKFFGDGSVEESQ